jgi:hypothetical protein
LRSARPHLAGYLLFVAVVPLLLVTLLGGVWTQQGHTFARYVFPVQVLLLCAAAHGTASIAGVIRGRPAWLTPFACVVAGTAYLALNPAIRQVATLGPWYGHILHQFDYVAKHNRSLIFFQSWPVPAF